jgi:rhodanese-related sulfurtransferase
MNFRLQFIYLIIVPSFLGLGVNFINQNSLPLVAKSIEEITSSDHLKSSNQLANIRKIDIKLALELYSKKTLFVDARSEEYLSDGIIPGAIFNDDIEILSSKIDSVIGLDSAFVVYCSDDDCGSSEDLAFELQDLGFTNILVFSGGWKSWTDSGYEIQKYE